ncbi:hypothetical protein JTB14_025778 [Gonioctena quinquepunctata]|nr:hypothetical protein JTB14_025778 [Gonioctena quinquepunctata]
MSSKKRLTVQDVADMFESEQFWADFENDGIERVYIEPPDDKEESDEDSGDESGGLLDNLAGRQKWFYKAGSDLVLRKTTKILP